jgi:twitching motility protein PilI
MTNSNIVLPAMIPQKPVGDSYLKFQVNQKTNAVLSMRHTQEAVVVPIQLVTPMPNMPGCILGLMNWRNRVFWAIDLPGMLNLSPVDSHIRQYNVIVIHTESVLLGLVVQAIKGTTRLLPDAIQSPVGQVPPGLVPYLQGCVVQEKEMLLVLDAQAIVHSSILRTN